jgi:hypothetical protein
MADMTEGKAGSVIDTASINPDEKTDLAMWLKMVDQLRHAPEWPEDELPIEMKQTHISVLLLSRNYVIKLKKPVDFGFLDYTTLNKRLKACEDEVRLNRRLCPDTYIGVSSVSEVDGQIRLSGRTGKIVDYCSMAERMAMSAGAEWRFIECRLAPELAHKRIEERAARKEGLSDATWEIYLRQCQEGGVLCGESDGRSLALDTRGNLAATARATSDWLRLPTSETISANTIGGGER